MMESLTLRMMVIEHSGSSSAAAPKGNMKGPIVECEDICAITGYDRPADAARCLRDQGIKVFEGRGGRPWTTAGLIEAAGGLLPGVPALAPLRPDDVFDRP